MSEASSETVLVWAPRGRDSQLAVQLVERHGLRAESVDSVDEIVARMLDAGCVVIAAEALTPTVREQLVGALITQPPWADLPIMGTDGLLVGEPLKDFMGVLTGVPKFVGASSELS